MKKVFEFFTLTIIVLSLVNQVTGDGQFGCTLVKEYEEIRVHAVRSSDGTVQIIKDWEFKVKLWIETEKDGTWRNGSSYLITFSLQVTYIDFNRFSSFNFTNARIYVKGKLAEVIQVENFTMDTRDRYGEMDWFPWVGLGMFRAKPINEGKNTLLAKVDIEAPNLSDGWSNNAEPVVITVVKEVKEAEQAFDIMPIAYTVIGIMIGVVLIRVYTLVRKPKVKPELKTT